MNLLWIFTVFTIVLATMGKNILDISLNNSAIISSNSAITPFKSPMTSRRSTNLSNIRGQTTKNTCGQRKIWRNGRFTKIYGWWWGGWGG